MGSEPSEEGTEGPGPSGDQPPAAARRARPVVPALVFLAVLGALALLVAIRSSPEQAIRRLIDRQIKLATAQRFGQLHGTLSERAKAACPRSVFVSELQQLAASEGDFWSLIDYRNIHVEVQGDHADVTYVITYNGRVVERATPDDPDRYVRATKTVLGPKPNLQQALDNLAREASPGPNQVITQRQYEAQKARLLKFGTKPPVIYEKGQWYDDADSHIHCGG